MIINSKDLESGQTLEADLCIIGAGAAGITIAREFLKSNLKVCLLESGGNEFKPEVQDLYAGKVTGNILSGQSAYLTLSRLRYIGGTTNHWSGWCRPLDQIDFEQRPWVPDSGWCIPEQELHRYYARAAKVLQIADIDTKDEDRALPCSVLFGSNSDRITTKFFHVSPLNHLNRNQQARFRVNYTRKINSAQNINFVHHANVTELETDASGRKVTTVHCSTLEKKRFAVKARAVVIACGGIETARLLLLSQGTNPKGLGNDHDLVGRYFMEHLHIPMACHFLFTHPENSVKIYKKFVDQKLRQQCIGVLTVAEEVQRKEQLLNACAELRLDERDIPHGDLPSSISNSSYLLDQFAATTTEQAIENSRQKKEAAMVPALLRIEQIPDPNNRVMLDTEVDSLGLKRSKLHWTITNQDRESYERVIKIMAEEFAKKQLGRLHINQNSLQQGGLAHGGSHHMGTTKMHDNPKKGVVDANCKLHAVDNTFIASSAVFPSVGFANPTFTIVTLAVRLADYLKDFLVTV